MEIEQTQWRADCGWRPRPPGHALGDAQLVFVFASRSVLEAGGCLEDVRRSWPRAQLFGCSTAGEICGTSVVDDSLVATAVRFERTEIRGAAARIVHPGDSFVTGQRLAATLPQDGLSHVLVLSDGIHVNGSELVAGLGAALDATVGVTGGLSGDGDQFRETRVLWDGAPEAHAVAVLGLYGPAVKVGCGSLGGWDSFGPERLITRSQGNVLHELDGRSALELYKQYLGEHAQGLPATGLLFPLSLRTPGGGEGVVRTILSIDEIGQSLTFAGDMPQGSYARLMKANFDRLIDGAAGAARSSHTGLAGAPPDLALLISCVGRKLVLRQRVEEEVEGVRDVLGKDTVLTGFYSYGEISPFTPSARCELHNQTMTITTFTEV